MSCALRGLSLMLAAAPLAAHPAAVAKTAVAPAEISAHVREAAQRFRLPERWIWAVMRAESAGRIAAVSRAGAMGLMQLMPGTWARQRAQFGLGHDPFDPRDNIIAGTSYLREMYDRYGSPGFLAAYNAGPGRYEDWQRRGRPLPAETRAYVAKLSVSLGSGVEFEAPPNRAFAMSATGNWANSGLFTRARPAGEAAPLEAPDRLFVPVAARPSR